MTRLLIKNENVAGEKSDYFSELADRSANLCYPNED